MTLICWAQAPTLGRASNVFRVSLILVAAIASARNELVRVAVKLDPPRTIVGDLDEREHSRDESINYVDVSSRGRCPWSMLPQRGNRKDCQTLRDTSNEACRKPAGTLSPHASLHMPIRATIASRVEVFVEITAFIYATSKGHRLASFLALPSGRRLGADSSVLVLVRIPRLLHVGA